LNAKDGQEALSFFAAERPDVVITDVQMPGMDGVSLLKKLKDHDPTVPVILITGYPSLDVAIRGMKEGASDFLTKPFRFNQVLLIIEKALRERRLLLENQDLKAEIQHKRAIEKLNEKLNRRVRELTSLYTYGEDVSAFPLNHGKIISSLIDAAKKVIHAQEISFLVRDEENSRFLVMARSSTGLGNSREDHVSVEPGSVLDRAHQLKEPQITNGRGYLDSLARAENNSQQTQIAVPLLIKESIFGIFHAVGKIQGTNFDQQDLLFLSELAKRASLDLENKYLYDSVFDVLMSTLRSLVSTIEARDPYTNQHSQRVTDFSVLIAEELKCSAEEVDTVRVAGYLHDLGKLGVKDSILLKADRLTFEEFEQIKAHPQIGEAIIAPLGFLPEERALIRHHHERWDGKGYPDGLEGEQIPFLARILSVADSFDAMTSNRPYRPAMSFEKGYEEIVRCSGTQFDPRVVVVFQSAFVHWVEQVKLNPIPDLTSQTFGPQAYLPQPLKLES
jgi:response regulator RpfG family c-di-GMP phosphodiesterase